ncbi:hypothetical protein BDV33DRAFT_166905 [Aspergillus novoparasiticus]|uniref:Carrier domain-containing protein n=1 Tax=Aspergillus novoparasiticus TaxID=986946 RepID=A0A5N6F3C3_9EURO|nr:hypothetical protein BDV33DRAFT_166905 [Aspergillus novoparasiticus]
MAEHVVAPIGKRLMVQVIDDVAERDPERKVCAVPKGSEISDGFFDLTFRELAHAVNYMSWWIVEAFGRSSTMETLTYLGANDIRYLVMVMACNKTGYKPLLSSTRNSDEAHLRLLEVTNCSKLAYSTERSQRAMEIKALRPDLTTVKIPASTEILGGTTIPYLFSKSFEEVKDDVAFIAHSSGTTGIPKPIQLTFGYFGALDAGAYVPIPPGRFSGVPDRLSKDDVILAAAPFFHLMGFSLLIISVFHGIRCVVAPDKPLSTEFLTAMLNATKPTAILLPPCILEDMTLSQASMEALWNLKYVFWGGSSLSPEVGRKIREHTPLAGFMGMTEAGFILSLAPEDKEDWEYFEWWPTNGIEMELVDDDLYEMVIHRHYNPFLQPIFHTFPDLDEYHTKDVYTRHPTKSNLWKLRGRLDDVVSLSNGEKFNPVTMEKIIEGHALVARAVVVGNGKFQPALLVEPNWNQWSEDNPVRDLIAQIWPTVQDANRINPAHGRIMKNKVGVASKTKPFQTTPKGSTQRRLVTRDYEKEIEDIYTKQDDEITEYQIPDTADLSGIQEFVRNVVSDALGFSSFSDQTDFYSLGLDSLQTMQLSRTFQGSICSCRPSTKSRAITAQNIYGNPTVEQLAKFIYGITSNAEQSTVSRSEKIDALVQKYTVDLPEREAGTRKATDQHTVILTGSTGSLGNYLLHALLSNPSVVKVYCLNRSEAKDRQVKSFQEKGLECDFSQGRVEFLVASFGEEKFGLCGPKYEEMLRTVTTVVHNAWRMDFNISVDSFDDVHIRGVRHFIDFSLQSIHNAHIFFMSSIGTIGGWTLTHGPSVPETPLEDCDVTLRQGYAEAKHICERICLAASQKAGVPTTLLRLGQIAGPTTENGMWNRQEWLPLIVATSKAMGKIPRTLGSMPVEWTPVDTLATIITELIQTRSTSQTDSPCSVFHLVNPSATSWESLLPAVQERYNVQPIEMSEWVTELESITNPSPAEVAAKPALKLLGFYQGLVEGEGALSAPIEVEKTKEASITMKSMRPISIELMANWLKQWSF